MLISSDNLVLWLGFVAIFGKVMGSRFIDTIDTTWYEAHATFYGDISGYETMRKDITNTLY